MDSGFRIGEGKRPWAALLVLAGICIGLLSLSNMVAGFWAIARIGVARFQAIASGGMEMDSEDRYIVMGLQGIVALSTFILGPVLYVRAYERKSLDVINPKPLKHPLLLIWPALLIPAFLPLLELVVEWNKGMDLPDWLGGFETWAFDKEKQLEGLTRQLTSFDSFGQFLFGLLVIAVLPAIGEELLFRGVIQPLFRRALGNWHLAIWATAILFSAIHLQFYGFLPRMLLGLLFGYLYWWSGNIWVPVLGHFVNNALTVTMLYLHKTGQLGFDPEQMPPSPLPILILSSLIGGAALWRFRERFYAESPQKG